MVINSASLGLFGGGMPAAPTQPAIGSFKRYQRDQVAARTDFMERTDIQGEIAYFKKAAAKVTDVDGLMQDRRLLTFVATAFGLESEVRAPGKLRAVLNSDINDINSFANRLRDPRFGEIARFFDTQTYGMAQIRISDKQSEIVEKYLTNAFERDMGQRNPALRDALFFLRKINDVTTPYEIMGDAALRRIVSDALNIPPEVARQSLNTQVNLFERKLPLDQLSLSSANDVETGVAARRESDLQKISDATTQVESARTQLGALSDIVEILRADQSDLAAVTDAAGVNAEDIEIQRNALTSLVTQAGLISAADTGLTSARGYFDTLTEIYDQAGTTSDATTLASLQTDFETAATSVVSALNNASYGDANLLTDAADDLTATIDTNGVQVLTSFGDLTDFLDALTTARADFAALTVDSLSSDLGTVLTSLEAAEDELVSSEVSHQVNAASLSLSTQDVTLAQPLNNTALTLGYDAILDAQTRSTEIRAVLDELTVLAEKAQLDDADLTAINTQYGDLKSRLYTAITTAGAVTSDGTTVTFDNLLNGGDRAYLLFNAGDDPASEATTLTAEATDLESGLYDALVADYATLGADNAGALQSAIGATYLRDLDTVDFHLARDQHAFAFAVATADPQGRLDQKVRDVESRLDDILSASGLGGYGLLSPYGSDISIITQSTFGNLRVEAQRDFQDNLTNAISAYRLAVLQGGDSDARASALNDMMVAVGGASGKLTAQRQNLDLQYAIIDSERESDGATGTGFLKPLQNSAFAIKFIEQYLVRKDAEMAGAAFGPAATSGATAIKAALIGTIRPLQPAIGGRLNLLL